MKFAAERVLDDVILAHDLLEKTEDEEVWRIYFVACLSLLRAVGHVLDKVDGCQDTLNRKAIDQFWFETKNDRIKNGIFWYFVDVYRNQVLKTYEFPSEPLTYGLIVPGSLLSSEQTDDDEVFWSDGIIMQEGPFEGHDARDLIFEATKWWQVKLSEIKESIAQSAELKR